MATAESVKAKIRGLIDAANTATGSTDADLTTAVSTLVDGYGKGSGGEEDIEAMKEKLDLYERYLRAEFGESFKDWNPQPIDPNETATLDEAPQKYKIEVETRGVKYTVRGDCKRCVIFPDMTVEVEAYKSNIDAYNTVSLAHYFSYGDVIELTADALPVYDASRHKVIDKSNGNLIPTHIGKHSFGENYPFTFIAFPEFVKFGENKYDFLCHGMDEFLSKGLSFGKKVSGMSASTFYYSQLDLSDKPVYVMEGFTGNLYLAKLNISAEHLIGIINNLGEGSYKLNIGSHNMAKLTAEQIQIATDKGWTVS